MSNLGLEYYLLKNLKIKLKRSLVGDINVINQMSRFKSNLGGEQSGHIILSEFSKTGDGILAALKIIEIISKSNKPSSLVFSLYKSFPQVKLNIPYKKISSKNIRYIENMNKKEFKEKNIRFLIRISGTEPLIRILVEGDDMTKVQKYIKVIEKDIRNNLE